MYPKVGSAKLEIKRVVWTGTSESYLSSFEKPENLVFGANYQKSLRIINQGLARIFAATSFEDNLLTVETPRFFSSALSEAFPLYWI